jgi:hypothetical protein
LGSGEGKTEETPRLPPRYKQAFRTAPRRFGDLRQHL